MSTEKNKKNAAIYSCEPCDFICSKKSNYCKHITTNKHLIRVNVNTNSIKKCQKMPITLYCLCGKKYTERSGLWRHKKKCNEIIKSPEIIEDEPDSKISKEGDEKIEISSNLIIELLKQNQEFQKQIIELSKEKGNIINSYNNTTKFSLNLFLNEQCKDALDIMDFVASLKLQLEDLENTGKFGYVQGISKIFLRGLKELDIHKRPIHCSDIKRETLYIKDKNLWEKDNEKEKIKLAIRHIADKNFKQIPLWVKENPTSKDIESKKHDQYMKIINKSVGGINEEEDDQNYNKIISNVSKEVIIEKD